MKVKKIVVVLVSLVLAESAMARLTLADRATNLDIRIQYGSSDEGYGTIVGRDFIGAVLGDSILDDGRQVKFTSLCLELDEHINDSGTYKAMKGSTFYGSDQELIDSKCDFVSEKTALLVFKYLRGQLYSSGARIPDELAKTVQESIWLREDERADAIVYSGSRCYSWGNITVGQEALSKALNNTGKVAMVNLVDYYGDFMQSQLTAIVPAPATILLAGLGSSWVGFMRRKRLA